MKIRTAFDEVVSLIFQEYVLGVLIHLDMYELYGIVYESVHRKSFFYRSNPHILQKYNDLNCIL